jgi:solute carrier family 10 (sodium/bile acid cotransporter), member 7
MAGLSLKTEDFAKVSKRVSFNVFVPFFNFGVVSGLAYGLSRFLLHVANIIPVALADGMLICSALPLTISMVQVLTKAAGGDEAAAIFHSALGNMIGVVLSHLLILGYLGVTSMDIADLGSVFISLLLRVVLPLIVGQIVQKTVPSVVQFVKTHKVRFKMAQQYCLVFIVYTVFCKTFEDSISGPDIVVNVVLMIVFQFLLLLFVMILAWYSLAFLFPTDPALRIMGLFGCTHKTVAMGIPLINAIYFDNPNVGLYTLPLLVWHTLQLLVGTTIAPRLNAWVQRENARLGIGTIPDVNGGCVLTVDAFLTQIMSRLWTRVHKTHKTHTPIAELLPPSEGI